MVYRISSPISAHGARSAVASLAAGMILAGCGGGGTTAPATGGGAPPVVVNQPVVVPTTLSGTVAVGAPMLNATVTVKDANGTIRTGTAAADGSYSGISSAGLVAPFSLQACGLVDGNYACYYSIVQQPGVANVTPLTNATVALAMGKNPADLFATTAPAAAPTASDLDAQKAKLKIALAELLVKAGVADIDFATTPFSADRTGMDKVLDSIKINTGTDGATNKAFVQMEGIIGSGNVFLDKDAAASGALSAGTGADVDLKGISSVFVGGLSFAIAAPDEATCANRMSTANIFDAAFSLDLDDNLVVDKTTAPAKICEFINMNGLLGGAVANPVLRDCDFTTDVNRRVCTVGFTIAKGENSFEGAELAVVLRPNAAWKLLGRDSPYDINIGAAIQRTSRADLPETAAAAQTEYTRALTFDIGGTDGASRTGIRAAKVFQRNLDNSGWEATPLATLSLSDACIAALQPNRAARLTIDGHGNSSVCGSSWLSLGDSIDGANAAAIGDQLIDNFYKRGRKVKIDLYADVAASGTPITVIKRVEGVPPKFAALANFPWMEMDATTRTALAAFDGATSTFAVSWIANKTVGGKDLTFCLGPDCSNGNRAGHQDVINGRNSVQLALQNKPLASTAFKMIGMYGRNADQLGVSTNYVSCGGAPRCGPQQPPQQQQPQPQQPPQPQPPTQS